MLASQRPHTPRTPNTHPLPISRPIISTPRPSSQTTIVAPASPPKTPPRGRRPSLSNTMHWLSRSPTQSSSSSPYSPTKPMRISEPKLIRSIEVLSQRSGVLGSGATVVRTPDEALRHTGVRLTFDGKSQDERSGDELEDEVASSSYESGESLSLRDELPSPPNSPPLPPLPFPAGGESRLLDSEMSTIPPRRTRTPPPHPPPPPPLRTSLKMAAPSNAEDVPRVPSLPANITTSPPPAFKPILVSEVPTGAIDTSKIIVTLETCTVSYRTTLDTLTSHPSHLSSYITSLFHKSRPESDTSSVYSSASDDMSAFRHHLTSQGLLPKASFSMHIFLDRPSAPYSDILTYLRSPLASPDVPETLPRATHLQSSSHARLEALVELRDEAAYLGLEGLHKLCIDELRQRHGPRLHTRGRSASSGGSIHSLRASVHSLHALLERVENDLRTNQLDAKAADAKSIKDGANEVVRSPPTPLSWNGHGRARSQSRQSSVRSPPAGWI